MVSDTFAVNERVLCYHGPMIYEAKILKIESFDETTTVTEHVGTHYFVHYKGWKATWDEWVSQARVLKWNDVNLSKQKALHSDIQAAEKKRTTTGAHSSKDGSKSGAAGGLGGAGMAGTSGSGGVGAALRNARGAADSKKRKREDDDSKKPQLQLVIPDVLKVVLVDDWEYITRMGKLVELPRHPSVQEILKDFQEHILAMPQQLPHANSVIITVISGIQTYFDRALGSILLYRYERAQYAAIRKQFITGQHVKSPEDKPMSSIYGAEHLARLLVKLPEMVAHTTMDDASVALLREYVHELMNWMVKRKDELFLTEYINTAPGYSNISRA